MMPLTNSQEKFFTMSQKILGIQGAPRVDAASPMDTQTLCQCCPTS